MNRCSKRLKGSNGEDEDRLSSFPDAVLVRILSFLPARDAARTCLIQTFGHLWTNIDTLDFDDSAIQDENMTIKASELKFMRFVNWFLLLHKRSEIREFRLKFTFPLRPGSFEYSDDYEEDEKRLHNEVQMFIKAALSRGAELLHFRYGLRDIDYEPPLEPFKLPYFAWTNKTLVQLSLFNCEIELPELVRMDSLRILNLEMVTLSKEVLGRIASNCHLLRELIVCDCTKLDVISFSAPNIETLHVSMSEDDTWGPIVNCPNVRYFGFSGFTNCVELRDLSSLKIASLCSKVVVFEEFRGIHKFNRFLEKMQHA